MSERRRHARKGVNVPLHVRTSANGGSRWVEARDVSEAGLAFETRRPVEIEDDSPIYVDNLGGEVPDAAHVEVRVVHIARDEDTGRFRVGVEFTGRRSQISKEQLEERLRAWKGEDSD